LNTRGFGRGTDRYPHKPEGFTKSLGALNLEDFPFASIDPIVLSWSNPDNEYYQVAIEYAESDTPRTILICQPNVEAGNQFSELPQQTNSYEIRPFSVSYVGTHRAILYRVNPEYALFAQEEGADSQTLAAPFTNVENGLGIFTGIATDTLLFEVRENQFFRSLGKRLKCKLPPQHSPSNSAAATST
jgi:hypothetical protein